MTVISHLKEIFGRHGIPKVVFTDNATQFTSESFVHFSKTWEFEHHTSSPHFPQSNGMVERCVQSVKSLLKKCKYDKTDPFLALLEFRNTPLSSDIPSPAELLFNRKIRGIVPGQSSNFRPKMNSNVRSKLIETSNSKDVF